MSIREGLARLLCRADDLEWTNIVQWQRDEYLSDANDLSNYLTSQGVVQKVEGELPKMSDSEMVDYGSGYSHSQQDMFKAGYTLTKPLE